MSAAARLNRLVMYVNEADKHDDIFTPTELDHIVEDSKVLFTPEVARLIERLVIQIRRKTT